MSRKRSDTIRKQSLELAFSAPIVVAQRLSQFAAAGTNPAAADYREAGLMWFEKMSAVQEAWLAMNIELCKSQQAMTLLFWRSLYEPRVAGSLSERTTREMNRYLERSIGAGLKPVHSRAVANAKRLGGRKA